MGHVRLDDPDLPLADLMAEWPQTIPVFMQRKLLCVGCPVSPFHTISDVCAAYCLDEEMFMTELMQAAGLV
ncbi:hybrid cluster-associated redox disulfide protein [Rhodovulum imhoffii]|uniref:Hybrid cluster-associated redox disulfide protein n=1 Tax=Rhodovulum imhoffii TaxID=365340 RepID=A0A2T5BQY5_9RHOB|nr:DUF1858 domain-containing protein [Rhodovulum imhoffii]MBK5932605.1 hypothetical protein [Rhodovulum imhoffii]PTN01612.1 hybrid cluster-associated redox disulfide protein [Rhodovulum imhoffii]